MKLKDTAIPKDRPGFNRWTKQMRMGGVAYYVHPDGKQKADRIMENVGLDGERIPSYWERILNGIW